MGMADPSIRASHADREKVVAALRQHTREGRLTLDEFEERVGEVYAARTLGDLDLALRELPAPVARQRRERQPRRRRHRPRPRLTLSGPVRTWAWVNLMLVAIWLMSGAGYFWPVWCIVPWGLCLLKAGAFHGAVGGWNAGGHCMPRRERTAA